MTTPALLFPAVSLILLAYTNRFLALATLIRTLHQQYRTNPDSVLLAQLHNLRHRVRLIRAMQTLGVASLCLCVVCMLVLFFGFVEVGKFLFSLSLILLTVSLGVSLHEVQISVDALTFQLHDIEEHEQVGGAKHLGNDSHLQQDSDGITLWRAHDGKGANGNVGHHTASDGRRHLGRSGGTE